MTQPQVQNAPKKERNATQRIQDLEQGLMSLFATLDNMARDLILLKDAMKLLDNKVSAIIQVSEKGDLVTNENVSKIMVDNNVGEMAAKVKLWLDQGFLGQADQVGEDSFVVLRELNDEGGVVNPRYQFVYSEFKKQNASVCEKIIGTKAGDVVRVEEGKFRLEILEVYNVQQQKAPAAQPAAPAEVAPEAAPAAAPDASEAPSQPVQQ